jgi:DNA-binding HxlR family transcriptional regulator
MAHRTSSSDLGCVAAATAILGDKWTPRILRTIIQKENVRFGELQTLSGGTNPRTLSARLLSLEKQGIIIKTIYAEVPPRTEYTLTQKGLDLLPILTTMAIWSEKYAPQPSESGSTPVQ